jgi:hypothetical protein
MNKLPVKPFKIVFFCIFIFLNASAQNPKAVEADICRSFKRITYWFNYRREHSGEADSVLNAYDSLETANTVFGDKLKYYTAHFPYTIKLKFSALNDEPLAIYDSPDGMVRIYSWDTEMGGTMHDFENVIQYRSGKSTKSVLMVDTAFAQDTYINAYSNVYTLKAGNKTYYLASYYGIFSGRDRSEGIQAFSIDNGIFHNARIIKTRSGLHSKLEYSYDLFSVPEGKNSVGLTYYPVSKTIALPLVTGDGKVHINQILYKFTGRYFEKVKN